jgi:hypothetical protein
MKRKIKLRATGENESVTAEITIDLASHWFNASERRRRIEAWEKAFHVLLCDMAFSPRKIRFK